MTNWPYLLLVACMFASPSVRAEKPRIGLLLPLSGPLAYLGYDASKEISRILGGVTEILEEDTAGGAEGVGRAVKALQDKKAELIIGPITSGDLAAVIQTRPAIPVLALVQVANSEAARRAREANVTTFTQPEQQNSLLARSLGTQGKFFVTSSAPFAAAAEQIANSMSGVVAGKNTTLSTATSAERTLAISRERSGQNIAVVTVAGPGDVGRLLQGFREQQAGGVIVSPPSLERTAPLAAHLARQWSVRNSRSAASWYEGLRKSAFYTAETGSLALDWTVSTHGVQLAQTATANGTPCRCASKDGWVSHYITCQDPPEKCKVEQKDATCNCKCIYAANLR